MSAVKACEISQNRGVHSTFFYLVGSLLIAYFCILMERAYIRPEVVRGLYQDYRCPILYTSTQEIRSDFFGRGEGGKGRLLLHSS